LAQSLAASLCAAEFVLHHALDYAKAQYSADTGIEAAPCRFWALHGIDQLAHQLTYAALIYMVLAARGLA
jgi:hypothetical protein